jgi:hypothetical protein
MTDKFVKRVEDAVVDFLTTDEVPASPVGAVVDEELGVDRYDPPADWDRREPPTSDDEEAALEEAFGAPNRDGIYAPHIEGVGHA